MPVTALDAATDVLTRARDLLALDTPSVSEAVREDLRRTALALGVAALDTYMHWAIRKVSFARPLPKKLAKIPVTFGEMLHIANDSIEARKKGIANRPQVRARNVLNEKLLKMTFQSSTDVEGGLQMLGVKDPWRKLAASIQPPATPAELKDRLDQLSHRRNKVVHEGDLIRQDRPQTIRREPIVASEVVADLDWIESFVKALAAV